MGAFTLLDTECANNSEKKPRVPNAAVEIISGCRLTLEWDKMFAQYVLSIVRKNSHALQEKWL